MVGGSNLINIPLQVHLCCNSFTLLHLVHLVTHVLHLVQAEEQAYGDREYLELVECVIEPMVKRSVPSAERRLLSPCDLLRLASVEWSLYVVSQLAQLPR